MEEVRRIEYQRASDVDDEKLEAKGRKLEERSWKWKAGSGENTKQEVTP